MCEVIYPNILKKNISLPNYITEFDNNFKISKVVSTSDQILKNNLEKARDYLEKKEYTSAWIYADLESYNKELQRDIELIKKEAIKGMLTLGFDVDDKKYIETIRYKNLINQNKILEAYYFCLEKLNNSIVDQDFEIKLQSCYTILIHDYYSIDRVLDKLNSSGYSDIRFYSIEDGVKLFTIEKLVEDDGEFFLQNVKINSKFYPFLYIDKSSKIYSSGFKEDYEFVYNFDKPNLPIKPEDLKLFSKELLELSTSSLHFNIKVLSLQSTKYFKESKLNNLLLTRFVSYLSILILFFMSFVFIDNRGFVDYFFAYSISILSIRWFIKRIGLILIDSGLGLSLIIISIFYILILAVLIKKFNPKHVLS